MVRNPNWTRDELILACSLVLRNGGKELPENDPRVQELSALLQHLSPVPAEERDEKFRSPGSVRFKMSNIASQIPGYQGVKTNGGRLDKEVVDEFLANATEMHWQAEQIKVEIDAGATAHGVPADVDLDEGASEGGLLERRRLLRERDPRLRRDAVAKFKKKHNAVFCEVCAFDFSKVYGERGQDFAEVHHRLPLSVSGPTLTKLEHLVLLCSNCHRMIHRTRPWLTVEKLVALVQGVRVV